LVNPQQISSYIRKPYALDAEAEANLREIIKEYPYFSNAWLLLARSLHNQNHSNFDEVLKQASMYGGDRGLLYKLVNITAEEADEKTIPADTKVVEPPLTEAEQEVIATTTLEEEPKEQHTETVEEVLAVEKEQEHDALLTEEEKLEEIKHDRGEPIEEAESFIEEGKQIEKVDEQEETAESIAEEDKVKSTFEEIFSNAENSEGENNVSNEFETFDINESIEKEPILPNFDDEDDFVLQVEDNDESADIMADAIVAADDTKEEAVNENANISAKEENTVEKFEQNIDEPEESVSVNSSYSNSDKGTEPIADNNQQQTSKVEGQKETQPEESEQSEELKEREAVGEAIAFKLNSPSTEIVENNPESKSVADTNELLAPSTFFEWLTQLKNPQSETTGSSEKKNELTKQEQVAESEYNIVNESQAESSTPPQKSSSVDDIIERFIQINPTISRPKTEFYNPEVKSKESDTESDDLATETLAKIYIQQNLNDKAVEIYNRLIKIHPEKEEEYKAAIAEIG
jgi:tetratricopeptide (TPR) repeat protein